MRKAIAVTMPEGLPFERRTEDSEMGWALYLDWMEAPSGLTLEAWARSLTPDKAELAVVEGRTNEWCMRKKAFYRYAAEMASCQAAMEAAKAALTAAKEWQDVLMCLTDDLDAKNKNYTDAKIERLRVVSDSLGRLLKETSGNKFVIMAQFNNFGRRVTSDSTPLDEGWNRKPTVIENEEQGDY